MTDDDTRRHISRTKRTLVFLNFRRNEKNSRPFIKVVLIIPPNWSTRHDFVRDLAADPVVFLYRLPRAHRYTSTLPSFFLFYFGFLFLHTIVPLAAHV